MKYKNLIFDLDGTLWDSRSSIIDNWNEVLFRYNYLKTPLIPDDMNPYMGLLADDVLKDIVPGISDAAVEKILREIQLNENKSLQKNGGKLYDGVEETLKILKQNHSLFIVSNCQDGYIEAFLDFFGFHDLFQDFESYGRTGKNKAENIQILMNRNRITKDNSVYIGDTSTDFQSATANQLDFIFCSYGFGEISSENPTQKITNFSQLKDILAD